MQNKRAGKVRPQDIPQEERYKIIGEFFDIVDDLKRKREIIDFFIGLLTPSESLMLARRIQIAKCLLRGDSYGMIKKKIGVGNNTIASVEKWLQVRDGRYKKILSKHFARTKHKNNLKNGMRYRSALDRYPEHRLIKELLGLDSF